MQIYLAPELYVSSGFSVSSKQTNAGDAAQNCVPPTLKPSFPEHKAISKNHLPFMSIFSRLPLLTHSIPATLPYPCILSIVICCICLTYLSSDLPCIGVIPPCFTKGAYSLPPHAEITAIAPSQLNFNITLLS